MWKRLISIILLFVFLLQSSFSLELYSSIGQTNLTNLEDLMTNLQNDLITQQILAQNLQELLTKAEKKTENVEKQLNDANQYVETLKQQLAEASELSEKQSKLLKKQDFMSKVWKWSLAIGIPIAFTTGLIVGWNLKE